jgi:uncharacterized membrane protein YhaH (DUF805 family)
MDNLNPVNLRNAQAKFRRSSRLTSKKFWIWALSGLIVAAMIAWLTFLGWGLIEALRAVAKLVTSFF